MSATLKHKILSGVFWQGLERFSGEAVQFVVSIILARLLAPEEFGAVAILLVFIKIFETFVDGGFLSAIIQRPNLTDTDCDTVFWINIAVSVCCYGLLFLFAPWFADFYHLPQLVNTLRIMGLSIPISGCTVVAMALLQRKMLFKFNFTIQISAIAGSSVVSVLLAYAGFGLWALVWQRLTLVFISAVLVICLVRYRPHFRFCASSAWSLFKYGGNMLLAAFLNVIEANIYTFVIGKVFSKQDLAYFNRGQAYPQLAAGTVNSILGQVMFPAFAQIQNDHQKVTELLKKSLSVMCFVLTPVLLGMLICAYPLIFIVLSEKWLPCVNFLRLFCIAMLFYPVHILNLQMIRAMGRSDYFLYLEIIKKIMLILAIVISYRFGALAIAASTIVTSLIGLVLHCGTSYILIRYGFFRQMKDLIGIWLVGSVAAGIAYCTGNFIKNTWGCLLYTGSTFLILYIVLSILFHLPAFLFIKEELIKHRRVVAK